MKEENKNGQLPEKEQLLSSLRNAEEMYVFMSCVMKKHLMMKCCYIIQRRMHRERERS